MTGISFSRSVCNVYWRRALGSRSWGCREHSAIPRTRSLSLSRSSLPAGDTFNIPCMTSAVQPLSHIPQLASHHRSACEHTPHRGHILAINPQVELASESTGEFCLKCDGTIRPWKSWRLQSGKTTYKKVLSICSSAPLCFIKGLHILEATKWLGGNPVKSQNKSLLLWVIPVLYNTTHLENNVLQDCTHGSLLLIVLFFWQQIHVASHACHIHFCLCAEVKKRKHRVHRC